MTAWQKQIRDARARDDADVDLFGRWWDGCDLTLSHSVVRKIDYGTARSVIEKYEWLGNMGAVNLFAFGIYFSGMLGGVVVYSVDCIENLGKWDSYGYTGKIILLSRGACVHWSPKGSASRLIRQSMKLLPARYEVITATVDPEAGEIGTIYQACGFYYVGQLNKGGTVTSAMVNGKRVGSRHLRRLYGTRQAEKLEQLGVVDVKVHTSKGRYFAFRGSKKSKREHYKALQNKIKPYPKRDNQDLPCDKIQTASS